jgi:hypothetical protein
VNACPAFQGDASVLTHHIRHPRPYGGDSASDATSPNTYP